MTVTPFIYNQNIYSCKTLSYQQVRTVATEANLSENEPNIHTIPEQLPPHSTVSFFERFSFFTLNKPNKELRTLALVAIGLVVITIFCGCSYFIYMRGLYKAQMLANPLSIADCYIKQRAYTQFSDGVILGLGGIAFVVVAVKLCYEKMKKVLERQPLFKYPIRIKKLERQFTKMQEKQEELTDLISLETFSKKEAKTSKVIHVEDDIIQSGYLVNVVLNMQNIREGEMTHPLYPTRILSPIERNRIVSQISKIFNLSTKQFLSIWQQAKEINSEQYELCCGRLENHILMTLPEVAIFSSLKNKYEIYEVQGAYKDRTTMRVKKLTSVLKPDINCYSSRQQAVEVFEERTFSSLRELTSAVQNDFLDSFFLQENRIRKIMNVYCIPRSTYVPALNVTLYKVNVEQVICAPVPNRGEVVRSLTAFFRSTRTPLKRVRKLLSNLSYFTSLKANPH